MNIATIAAFIAAVWVMLYVLYDFPYREECWHGRTTQSFSECSNADR